MLSASERKRQSATTPARRPPRPHPTSYNPRLKLQNLNTSRNQAVLHGWSPWDPLPRICGFGSPPHGRRLDGPMRPTIAVFEHLRARGRDSMTARARSSPAARRATKSNPCPPRMRCMGCVRHACVPSCLRLRACVPACGAWACVVCTCAMGYVHGLPACAACAAHGHGLRVHPHVPTCAHRARPACACACEACLPGERAWRAGRLIGGSRGVVAGAIPSYPGRSYPDCDVSYPARMSHSGKYVSFLGIDRVLSYPA